MTGVLRSSLQGRVAQESHMRVSETSSAAIGHLLEWSAP